MPVSIVATPPTVQELRDERDRLLKLVVNTTTLLREVERTLAYAEGSLCSACRGKSMYHVSACLRARRRARNEAAR